MTTLILTESEAARLCCLPGPRTQEALRILRDSERHLAADERRGVLFAASATEQRPAQLSAAAKVQPVGRIPLAVRSLLYLLAIPLWIAQLIRARRAAGIRWSFWVTQ